MGTQLGRREDIDSRNRERDRSKSDSPDAKGDQKYDDIRYEMQRSQSEFN